ncbi:MAG: late competence development ComFB family protein [Pseudanabaenaceae cyanobacterium]
MLECRNALEDLVLAEAQSQYERLQEDWQSQVHLNEIAAYALNRLPPMYATTRGGWSQLRKKAETEMKPQIEQTVRRALLAVRRDVLREANPLPEEELDMELIALGALQGLFQSRSLLWRDVPRLLHDKLMERKLRRAVSYTYLTPSQRYARQVKDYLKRSKGIMPNRNVMAAAVPTDQTRPPASPREFTNVLEKIVQAIAERQLQRIPPEAAARLNIYEIMAYALNRLPPMYASSEQGLKQQRYRAKVELSGRIGEVLQEAIIKVAKSPLRGSQPLLPATALAERDYALQALREMLGREDIGLENVAEVVRNALQQAETGNLSWQSQPSSSWYAPY